MNAYLPLDSLVHPFSHLPISQLYDLLDYVVAVGVNHQLAYLGLDLIEQLVEFPGLLVEDLEGLLHHPASVVVEGQHHCTGEDVTEEFESLVGSA